jgi:hypothetical protein
MCILRQRGAAALLRTSFARRPGQLVDAGGFGPGVASGKVTRLALNGTESIEKMVGAVGFEPTTSTV